ncbi:unnamed protein product [Urochloa decumbens]|uniref:Dirigent protein n=1 Tax=Urochloa decumbens TaxID=240449 RepID=A0ABC9D9A8_9POAL
MASLRNALAVSLAVALLAVAPATWALDEKELHLSLYLNQTYSGNGLNQAVVVDAGLPGSFGNIAVQDWAVVDAEGSDATTVGRAQGIHFKPSGTNDRAWYITLTIVFERTRFKGSMLRMMGYVPQDGQWSIFGGTGKLTMARGVVNHKIVSQTGGWRLYKIDIRAFYTPMDVSKASSNCDIIRKILAFGA